MSHNDNINNKEQKDIHAIPSKTHKDIMNDEHSNLQDTRNSKDDLLPKTDNTIISNKVADVTDDCYNNKLEFDAKSKVQNKAVDSCNDAMNSGFTGKSHNADLTKSKNEFMRMANDSLLITDCLNINQSNVLCDISDNMNIANHINEVNSLDTKNKPNLNLNLKLNNNGSNTVNEKTQTCLLNNSNENNAIMSTSTTSTDISQYNDKTQYDPNFNSNVVTSKCQTADTIEPCIKENKYISRTQKSKDNNNKSNTTISQQAFDTFVESFFKDIDTNTFDYITKHKKCAYITTDKNYEISNREKLISALIEEHNFDHDNLNFSSFSNFSNLDLCDKYLQIGNLDVKNENTTDNELNAFFEINNIKPQVEDNDLLKMYKTQMEINNRRKTILKNNMKKRLMYKSYLGAMKILDDAMIKLYVKRLKNKKRYKNDEFLKEMACIVEKRKELKEELKEFGIYEDYMFDVDDLFSENNVDTKQFNYNPKNFF